MRKRFIRRLEIPQQRKAGGHPAFRSTASTMSMQHLVSVDWFTVKSGLVSARKEASIEFHSYRSASMGSSRAAFLAG